jgi:hypothetical protein
MHRVAAVLLMLVAFVHLPPLIGVLGVARLEALYGIPIESADLAILMRHRAVLFGLLAFYQLWAIARPAHRTVAFVAGIASLSTFLALAWATPGHNPAITKLVAIDSVALVLAVMGLAAHLASQRKSA